MGVERSRFGPYELLSRLGAGGMAETFLAVRRGPGDFEQRVCLKRILPAFEEDAEFVRLFMEEARIAATLRHGNIVQVLDFGVADGSHFMALELIDGVDLRVLLRALRKDGEGITTGLVAHLAYELANALVYAHRADPDGRARGVVHRDISPSNVLVSTAGEVKLADFGIAKAMDQTQVTRSENTKGKVPYMAPEYALSGEYDARSDIFSLGVTLYECLAGERPFDGATELDTMRRVQEGLHTPLEEHTPTAPTALVAAIERCIATARADRFANAADLQDALVDVAPPPTARRILGELVERVREAKAPPPAAPAEAYADTLAATPSGTLVLEGEAAARDGHVVPAEAGAETRTALASAMGGPMHTATSMDEAAAEALRVADAATRALTDRTEDDREGPGTRRPDQGSPAGASGSQPGGPLAGPGRSARGLWLVAGGLIAVVGAGAIALLTAAGGSGDDAPELRHRADAPPAAAPSGPPPPRAAGPARDLDLDLEIAVLPRNELPTGIEAPQDEGPAEAGERPDQGEATPAETPRRGPSGLVIGILPYGQVWVDGRPYGSAPARVELRPGPHQVRVTGPNGFTADRRVRVDEGRMREVRFP